MRVLLAASMTAAVALVACGGCSSTRMPSLPTFGMKGKSKPKTSNLAPPGPQIGSMAGAAPNVSMPQSSAWSNLPVYPGTSYQQTPYPDHTVAAVPPPYASGAAAAPAPTMPMANPPPSQAPSYGAMPPAASAGPTSPYTAYPPTGGQPPPYSSQPAPTYNAPQVPNYAPPAAAPYAPGQASPYGGQPYTAARPSYVSPQASPGAATAPAFTAQQPPPAYSAAQNPYGATSEPYNAAPPQGSYTR